MYQAPDHQNIINLFIKYVEAKSTLTISKPGFYSYLALRIGYPGWLLKEIKRQVRLDEHLGEFIDTSIEGILLDGMNSGLYKEAGIRFTLKNHYGYKDNPEDTDGQNTQAVKTVVFKTITTKPEED